MCVDGARPRARAGMENEKKKESETNPGENASDPSGRQSTGLGVCMYRYVWGWGSVHAGAARREEESDLFLSRVFFFPRAFSRRLSRLFLKGSGGWGPQGVLVMTNGHRVVASLIGRAGREAERERGLGEGVFFGGGENKKSDQIKSGTGQRRGVGASRFWGWCLCRTKKKVARCLCVWLGLCVSNCVAGHVVAEEGAGVCFGFGFWWCRARGGAGPLSAFGGRGGGRG